MAGQGSNFAPSGRLTDNREFGAQRPPARPAHLANMFPNEDTVLMVFPRPVLFTTDQYKRIQFPAGLVEVPESLADNEYLALSGATRQQVRQIQELPPIPGEEETDPLLKTSGDDEDAGDWTKYGDGTDYPGAKPAVDSVANQPHPTDLSQILPMPKTAAELSAMTKQQLVDHAMDVHGVELDPIDKKDDLIAKVQEAQVATADNAK